MSSPRPAKICYLCGKTEQDIGSALTSDHIIPDCFFPRPKPNNLLTLPCCTGCQKEYQKDEEYVRNSLSAISNLGKNKDALYAWKAAHRALLRRPAIAADFRGRMAPFRVNGAKVIGLQFSQERTEKVIQKIAIGLHYHFTGKLFPKTVQTEISYQPPEILAETLKHAQYMGYFGNTFSYAGAVCAEGDAIWWFSFYASVLFIVILLPSGLGEPPEDSSSTEPPSKPDATPA